MACVLDHITVTAPTLAAGAQFVREALGVEMQAGGEHALMATHNLLLRLGPDMFLEVLAANPAAPRPSRPRWFGLDAFTPGSTPALRAWVARCSDVRATAAEASESLGHIAAVNRGALNWLLTVPEDGSIGMDGVAPALIEWQSEVLPPARLEDRGLVLNRLELFHPDPARVARLLSSIGFQGPVSVFPRAANETPGIVAQIDTPFGLRSIPGWYGR